MTKGLKVLRFGLFGLLGFFGLGFGVSEAIASERGIGVSPARIDVEQVLEWPYTTSILVTNLSSQEEIFTITSDQNFISANPGRFPLESGEKKLITLTFENSGTDITGIIKIAGTRVSPDGFVTGTGIKVPFMIEGGSTMLSAGTEQQEIFLAGIAGASNNLITRSIAIGLMAIIAVLVILWYFSIFARRYVFPK